MENKMEVIAMYDKPNPYWQTRIDEQYEERRRVRSEASRRGWALMDPAQKAAQIERLRRQAPEANALTRLPSVKAKRSMARKAWWAALSEEEKAAIIAKQKDARAAKIAAKQKKAATRAKLKAIWAARSSEKMVAIFAFYQSPEGSAEMRRRSNIRRDGVRAAREVVRRNRSPNYRALTSSLGSRSSVGRCRGTASAASPRPGAPISS
jgi:hypothetical protein